MDAHRPGVARDVGGGRGPTRASSDARQVDDAVNTTRIGYLMRNRGQGEPLMLDLSEFGDLWHDWCRGYRPMHRPHDGAPFDGTLTVGVIVAAVAYPAWLSISTLPTASQTQQ